MHLPIALTTTTIGIGIVLLVGIAAFFIHRAGKKSEPPVLGEIDSPPEGSTDRQAPDHVENTLGKG